MHPTAPEAGATPTVPDKGFVGFDNLGLAIKPSPDVLPPTVTVRTEQSATPATGVDPTGRPLHGRH